MRDRVPPWPDLLLGIGVATVALGGVVSAPVHQIGFRDPDGVALLVSVLQGLPLVARRGFPFSVLLVVAAATVAFFALGYPPVSTALLGALVGTYSLAAHASPRVAVAGGLCSALVVLALVAVAALRSVDLAVGEVGALALMFLTAWVLGDRMRTRRAYLAELEQRATRLERERERDAEAAAAGERSRIARELHDVVAHGVSVIVLHARGAKEVMDTDAEALRRSLDLIERTGREALTELRTVLEALRADEGEDVARSPQPGLAELPNLVGQAGEAGLAVEYLIEGEPRPVPTGVGLSAYRIVQEALTNVRKHSTARTARLVLRYGADELLVQVEDDGPPRAHSGQPGHGLTGMRERVALFGGRLQAGPRHSGGYEVLAVLPLRGSRP